MDQLENRHEMNRVNLNSSRITKQRAHMTEKCDRTPSVCSRFKASNSNRRIMVVDDEEGSRHILSTVLSGVGYEVVAASRGTEALNLLLKSSFALVLTDLEMPGMDGWELASRIKNRFPNIPVVLMTGEAKEDVIERMKMKGNYVDSVIFKPFRLENILKTVQKMLGTEQAQKSTPASLNNPAADQRTSG
jgi:CheY-like chemotaxis protein